VLVFVIVVSVALSGCAAFDSGPTDQTSAETSPAAEGPLPPGVDRSGDANATVILNETFYAIDGNAVRIDHRHRDSEKTVYHGPDGFYSRDGSEVMWGDRPIVSEETTPRTLAAKGLVIEEGYSVEYTRNSTLGVDYGGTLWTALLIRVRSGTYRYTGEQTKDGQTLHQIELVDTNEFGDLLDYYTATMLVDTDGRIHRLWGKVGDNRSDADEYEYNFDWSVESVREPSWLVELPRGTATRAQNKTVLAVTMTHGPPVPAGSTFTVSHGEVESTITLDTPLGPGETLRVAIRQSDREVVTARESLGGDFLSLQDGRTTVRGTATVDGTMVYLSFAVGEPNIYG
jgi:hypothetical protein